MALSSLVLGAAGVGMSTVGSYYESEGRKRSLALQAQLDEISAKNAYGAAKDAMQRGEREIGRSRINTANLKGKQAAELAAGGVDLGFGSAAAILGSTDLLGEIDASTIEANAVREAWGHRMEAVGAEGSATINRATAKAINPTLNAASTLLTGAGEVAGSYYALSSSGALKPGKATKPKAHGSRHAMASGY